MAQCAEVFAQRGYHATTIDDLSEVTGLQRGGLYHYIGSKQELLADMHERFIGPLLLEAERIEREAPSVVWAIEELAKALMRVMDEYRAEATVFIYEWRAIRSRPEGNVVRQRRAAFEEVIERILQRGVDEGALTTTDPELTMLAFLGMINYSIHWFGPSSQRTPDEIAAHFSRTLLYGEVPR